jgi:hypothetical protein
LSNPTRFELLKDVELLKAYPYLLPCIVASLMPLIGATLAAFFLKEVCWS